MKRTIAAILVLAALATASSASGKGASRWPASEEHAFLVNCKATSHGLVAMCKCTMRALEHRFTESQIQSLYLHHKPRFLAVMRQTVLTCVP